MQVIKVVFATLACLALLLVLAIYGGSRWISNNQEEIVRKVDETVGIGKQVKQHCGALETRFQREWDDAVNNDTIDRREAELSAMRREIDQLCNAK